MPYAHPVFGQILLTAKIIRNFRMMLTSIIYQIRSDVSLGTQTPSIWILGPFSLRVLVVISSHTMIQFIKENPTLPRHDCIRQLLRPPMEKHDLIKTQEQQWKTWKNIFDPGFSASHLTTMVPGIMKGCIVFHDLLRKCAKHEDLSYCKRNNAECDLGGPRIVEADI